MVGGGLIGPKTAQPEAICLDLDAARGGGNRLVARYMPVEGLKGVADALIKLFRGAGFQKLVRDARGQAHAFPGLQS
jgi:hypothetical protein